MEVRRARGQPPRLALSGRTAELGEARGVRRLHVSLSHDAGPGGGAGPRRGRGRAVTPAGRRARRGGARDPARDGRGDAPRRPPRDGALRGAEPPADGERGPRGRRRARARARPGRRPPDRGRVREGQQRRRRLRRGAPPARPRGPGLRVARGTGRRRAGGRAGQPGRAPARRRERGRGARRRRDALDRLRAELGDADLVVDALLGTGVRGPATGAVAAAIEAINAAGPRGGPSARSTCPRGSRPTARRRPGPVVRARVTVTFGLPKLGLVLPAGAAHAGRVEIADLGIPRAWLEEGIPTASLEAADVRAALPLRPIDAHKGTLRASPRGRGLRREDRRGGARLSRRPARRHGPRDVRDAGLAAARGGGHLARSR